MTTTIKDAFKYFMPFLILICLFFIVRSNNLSNPRIVRPEHYNIETYFPTPSVAVLDNYNNSIKYFCANHKINYSNLYTSWKFEQPCQECLSENNYYPYEDYKYNGHEWVFVQYYHGYINNQPKEVIGTFYPNNWKNPLTKIKNFDKIQYPYSHGFMVDSIDVKRIAKGVDYHHMNIFCDESLPKNLNTINYFKEWYYKIPDYDITKLNTPLGKIFGIHYKLEDY